MPSDRDHLRIRHFAGRPPDVLNEGCSGPRRNAAIALASHCKGMTIGSGVSSSRCTVSVAASFSSRHTRRVVGVRRQPTTKTSPIPSKDLHQHVGTTPPSTAWPYLRRDRSAALSTVVTAFSAATRCAVLTDTPRERRDLLPRVVGPSEDLNLVALEHVDHPFPRQKLNSRRCSGPVGLPVGGQNSGKELVQNFRNPKLIWGCRSDSSVMSVGRSHTSATAISVPNVAGQVRRAPSRRDLLERPTRERSSPSDDVSPLTSVQSGTYTVMGAATSGSLKAINGDPLLR